MKKFFSIFMTFVILGVFAFTGCGDDDFKSSTNNGNADTSSKYAEKYSSVATISDLGYRSTTYSPDDTWVVYWYLCGTDLESENGAATADLKELMEVQLPENVSVVIQTGGTSQWNNDFINPEVIQRHVYNSTGFSTVDEQPLSSMGDPSTLQGFLEFCEENYPANHKMFLFWDHGGGSAGGAEVDELFENDVLTLDEMKTAFNAVYSDEIETGSQDEIATKNASDLNIPYEIIGFDTCLMATVDTAKAFQKFGRYLVASEETEPGNGWYYTGWVGELAQNTATNGAILGKAICDSFQEGCELAGTEDSITLSVTDLINFPKLDTAYDNLGKEALFNTCENISFLGDFSRSVSKAENYGGNNDEEGYTNMVDLGDLARNSSNLLTDNSQAVLDALSECIVYKINGPYRTQATGLSCYYSFDNNQESFSEYAKVATSQAFKYLSEYSVLGEMQQDGYEYLSTLSDYSELPAVPKFEEDLPISISDDGYASLQIDDDKLDTIQSVCFNIFHYDEENQQLYMLGSDDDINADWENGEFKDNFDGTWASLDGHLVYMELTYQSDDYNTYSVPIKLNGEEYNLKVAYDYKLGKYIIMGATKGIDADTNMADKNLVKLKEGDEITTILYTVDLQDESENVNEVEVETFKIGKEPIFENTDLGDGQFAYMFEVKDINNKITYSDTALFSVENGEIFVQ